MRNKSKINKKGSIKKNSALSKRIFIPELQDYGWFPNSLRDAINDNIQSGINFLRAYRTVAPIIQEALEELQTNRIVDLGSGGGGPWPVILPNIENIHGQRIKLTMTDKHPNPAALRRLSYKLKGGVRYYRIAVDACNVPSDLAGFRTMFGSFHHFSNDEALRVLQDATNKRQGIGVFELTNMMPHSFLLGLFFPIFMILATPFIKPFRVSRIFWTYILPLGPLVGMIDGIISCFRTFSPAQEKETIENLGDQNYRWSHGRMKSGFWPFLITYLIGAPLKSAKGREL